MITSFYNFGSFTHQNRVHTYDSGVEGEAPIQTPYRVMVNSDGAEWHDLVEQHGPFDYYLAVADGGVIISAEIDPDESQFANIDLVGINVSEGFPYTRREGGTIYRMIWNGTTIVEPPETIPDEISRRQFFQQLASLELITNNEAKAALQNGAIPAALQALINQLPSSERYEAEMLIIGASTFARLHPLCDQIRILFEWSEEQRDNFWRAASKL